MSPTLPAKIFNMDQTPLWFLYHCSKTIQKKGMKTVHVRKSTNDMRRETAALTCTGDMDGTPMMRKAWRKTGYSWFEKDKPTAEPEPVVAEGGDIFGDEYDNDVEDLENVE
jgi:hypothetical protein